MQNQSALTGTVLLEAFWSSRRKDMIDLITPFIHYAVAQTTSPNENIDIQKVTNIIRHDFGYVDIPESVIAKILSRDKVHFDKKNREYRLTKSLDEQVERFTLRKKECAEKIDRIGESLFEYLKNHCKRTRIISKEQCIAFLQEFFSVFALQVGFDTLEAETISLNHDEINYFIAQYIFEQKRKESIEYTVFLDLTKGYFLRSAIYLQVDNANIKAASYKNTDIYYDTPILLQLLGYQSEQETDSAITLHMLLKKQGAKFFFFEQNEREMLSILTAYQHSLIGEQRSSRTLEGLDSKGYDFDGVTRIKKTFVNTLEEQFGIKLCNTPGYATKEDGCVDLDSIDISEVEAMDYVRGHTRHYTDDNLRSDVTSALAIHRIRNGVVSREIEKCKAIFVTTNVDFTNAFNSFYRENFGGDRVMPVITSFDLSAIAWVKGGEVRADIPERQLLTNSYTAMQPAPEIIEKCRVILGQLENEGKITKEEAVLLRADRVTQRELWIEYFPTVESIDDKYIEKLQQRQKQKLIGDTETEIRRIYRNKAEEDKKQKITDAKEKAHTYASDKKNQFIKTRRIPVVIAFVVIAVLCIIGLFRSLSSTPKSLFLIAFVIVSVLSIIDTLTSRGKFIGRWIDKKANHYETSVYEKKLHEYLQILK
ncbi:hypothetical protein [Oribacterium sp. oral taxon 078]|uniref:hypothetical protein n=1 Tax=Oribacterium sp. oral taxon 078 TaxID=652706 RepID=UPI0002F669C5|nr:hypothetical protein [Oribacterium sp. oral taxon 078]